MECSVWSKEWVKGTYEPLDYTKSLEREDVYCCPSWGPISTTTTVTACPATLYIPVLLFHFYCSFQYAKLYLLLYNRTMKSCTAIASPMSLYSWIIPSLALHARRRISRQVPISYFPGNACSPLLLWVRRLSDFVETGCQKAAVARDPVLMIELTYSGFYYEASNRHTCSHEPLAVSKYDSRSSSEILG